MTCSDQSARRLNARASPSVVAATLAALLTGAPASAVASPPAAFQAPPAAVAPRRMMPSEIYRHVLKSVVLILQTETDGNGNRSVSYGTGWVTDVDRGLIVTNQHVVDSSEEVLLIYPRMEDGRLRTAVEAYGLTADGFGYDTLTARGEVLHSENDRDLALIRAYPSKSGRRVPAGTKALAIANRQVWPGERVHTIAGWPRGSESLWIYGAGAVRQVSRRTLASGAKTTVMESDAPINQGNSGGAVVDDFGEVVAVVEGIQTNARGLSLFVGLDAVRDYLAGALPLVEPQTAEDRVKLARSHREGGRYDRGIRMMNDAVRMEPKNAGYLAERGLIHASNGDDAAAETDFAAADRLAPNDPFVQGGRGEYLWMRGELDQAIDALTRAIKQDPENPRFYEHRGLARRDAEEYDRAVRDLSRAIRLAPHDANLLMKRGGVYRLNMQYGSAADDHRAAAKLKPLAASRTGNWASISTPPNGSTRPPTPSAKRSNEPRRRGSIASVSATPARRPATGPGGSTPWRRRSA